MPALGVKASEVRIIRIDLGCGHVVERLASETTAKLRGTRLRCPWCNEPHLVIDIVGDPVETPRR